MHGLSLANMVIKSAKQWFVLIVTAPHSCQPVRHNSKFDIISYVSIFSEENVPGTIPSKHPETLFSAKKIVDFENKLVSSSSNIYIYIAFLKLIKSITKSSYILLLFVSLLQPVQILTWLTYLTKYFFYIAS